MKIKIISLFILTVFTFCADAQQSKWDSTYRPDSYLLKTGQYEDYPNNPTDIIFLGNSITYGTNWNELLQLPEARNRGISGDITFGVLQRLDEVIEGHPAKVFILIGINDISRNIPDSFILRNDKKIVERIKAGSPETKIYFQTLMPVNSTFNKFKNHYSKDEHILAVNEGLKGLAKEENITLIDLYPHFLDDEGRLKKEFTFDGLHPNAAGYEVWKEILLPYIRE